MHLLLVEKREGSLAGRLVKRVIIVFEKSFSSLTEFRHPSAHPENRVKTDKMLNCRMNPDRFL